jgi:hypothetical protein
MRTPLSTLAWRAISAFAGTLAIVLLAAGCADGQQDVFTSAVCGPP